MVAFRSRGWLHVRMIIAVVMCTSVLLFLARPIRQHSGQASERECSNCVSRSLLVTGLPRSGTTVMGYMASLLDHQTMIHEPSNPSNRLHLLGGRFLPMANDFPFGDGQFPDVASWSDPEPAARYFDAIFTEFCPPSSSRDTSEGGGGDSPQMPSIIIKDPTFLSSAEWLVHSYGVGKALVMIRHPAAVVASWKALEWEGGNIVRLSHLYVDMMTQYVLPLWDRYGGSLLSVRENVDGGGGGNCGRRWIFLRHEDFCIDPVGITIRLQEALAMPDQLGPSTHQQIVSRISSYIYAPSPNDGRHQYHAVHMETASQIDVWKAELSPFEVSIIRAGTEAVWKYFYAAEDWIQS